MRDEPLVSVIINNHNYGHFVETAIDSALDQTYRSIEVIVVDDGSVDDSRDVIAGYGSRITAVLKENAGQASALNVGFAASRGDVICFLDADDVWFPCKVEQVVKTLSAQPRAAWIRHKLEIADEHLHPIGQHIPTFRGSNSIPPDPYLYLEQAVTVSTSALGLRRSIGARVFPIPETEPSQHESKQTEKLLYDADAYINIALGAEKAWGYSLDEVLGYYRRHQSQRLRSAADATHVLRRQIQVALATCQVWAEKTGFEHISSSVYKHQLILAALNGQPIWTGERWYHLVKGLKQVWNIAPRPHRLALRQTMALFYAFVTPQKWLQRLLRHHGFGL